MDLKPPTTTIITTVAAADSPETDGETPIHSQLIKPFSTLPNGKHHYHHHHHQLPSMSVSYKECLKNHAATIGSHALDGCGEFMQSPTHDHTQSQHPTSLTCAACGCHRNFHRRETITKPHFIEFYHPHGDQNHMVVTPGTPVAIKIENPNGRKRFRTKFSQEQKEKMSNFAEKVGWKMQRRDDKMVFDFCNEIGIRRGIFKVWMHNNKNTFGKKDKDINSPTTTTTTTTTITTTTAAVMVTGDDVTINKGVIASNISNGGVVNVNSNSSDHYQENGEDGGGGVHLHASTNGSSSS